MRNDAFRWHRIIATLAGLVAAMNMALAPVTANAANPLADLSTVLGELRKGGFVNYFRHGTTSPFCRCKDTAQLAFGRFSSGKSR